MGKSRFTLPRSGRGRIGNVPIIEIAERRHNVRIAKVTFWVIFLAGWPVIAVLASALTNRAMAVVIGLFVALVAAVVVALLVLAWPIVRALWHWAVEILLGAALLYAYLALVHVVVSSVSGQAVLTMPLFVPMADLLGLSRQVPVVAYQTGAGLTELLTPTNGSLMAILLTAGVPFDRWLRFALGGVLLAALVGAAAIAFL